ncbi:MAG: DNA methyltransferase [Patescibacteria group bacterium]|nr:DNA methyltransferase [Patescibacteria group bacterium]
MKFPSGQYGLIYADPPWQFKVHSLCEASRCPDAPVTRNQQRNNSPERHYKTMPLRDIMALRDDILFASAPDCMLLVWAVDPMIPEAIQLGQHWGFTYKTVGFYWAKERRNNGINNKRPHVKTRPFPMGTGYWTRANPEQCLLFTRGNPKRLSASVEKLIVAPRREHSRKPDEVYDRIEKLIAGPYLELFARTRRPGWTCWGNQTEKFKDGA